MPIAAAVLELLVIGLAVRWLIVVQRSLRRDREAARRERARDG